MFARPGLRVGVGVRKRCFSLAGRPVDRPAVPDGKTRKSVMEIITRRRPQATIKAAHFFIVGAPRYEFCTFVSPIAFTFLRSRSCVTATIIYMSPDPPTCR